MNALISGSVWPLAGLVWPLLLALVPALPRWRARAPWLLPLAPLPALGFALAGAPGTAVLPDLLLGVELAAVPGGALLLGMTAVVWVVAGWHAALTLEPGPRAGILSGFWCLALAGNLGVFLAADIVTFYLAFATVSLAAWALVVHDRTPAALAAGRFYILLAVIGEAALLAGLLIGASAAQDLSIATLRETLPDAPFGQLAMVMLVLGFGIKAGMVPLHQWLPLAHPVAPVPGSAVLSGAIVKAGLIGVILFLPAQGGVAAVLLAAGLFGAFAAAARGLFVTSPKTVLAYSTVSQMGLLLALFGAGSGALAYYATHHGLAKAALFLSVGVLAGARTKGQRRATLAVAGLAALSVAGLPLLGGALAKLGAKPGLGDAMTLAVTLTGVTTTLILAWFLTLLARSAPKPEAAPWPPLFAGLALLVALALILPWALWPGQTALPLAYPLGLANLLDGLWPVLIGLALLPLLLRLPPGDHPPADPLDRARMLAARLPARRPRRTARPLYRLLLRRLARLRAAESGLAHWPLSGGLMIALMLALAIGLRP